MTFTMSDINHNQDFQLVTYKKRCRKPADKPLINNLVIQADLDFNKENAVRRIKVAKEDILESDFYSSIAASLREGLGILGKENIEVIICLGLGKFSECMTSRYQFALLLCLQELYKCSISAYDPAFTENDKTLLQEFNVEQLHINQEAKHAVNSKTTLFYLPHCPKQMTNNLLWSNWGLSLSNCIIVANSFNTILETHTKRVILDSANYIWKISPYVVELAIVNSFKYYDIFNDTGLHIFPIDKLQLISNEFWAEREEPSYKSDVEFIVKS